MARRLLRSTATLGVALALGGTLPATATPSFGSPAGRSATVPTTMATLTSRGPHLGSLASIAGGQMVAGVSMTAFAVAPRVVQSAQESAARSTASAKRAEAARASRGKARTSGSPRDIGRSLASARGWGGRQFACLDALWTKESEWLATADNPTSSAYGIPQALPGKKMSSHGGDWRTNPATQIRWGLDYIDDVYGTPCTAWSHSRAHNWY